MSNNIPTASTEKSFEELTLEIDSKKSKEQELLQLKLEREEEIRVKRLEREEKRLKNANLKRIENQTNLILDKTLTKKIEDEKFSFFRKNFTSWFNGDLNAIPSHIYIRSSIKTAFVESWRKSYLLSMVVADLYNLTINLVRYPLAKLYAYIYLPPDNMNIRHDGLSTAARFFVSSIAFKLYKKIDATKSTAHLLAKYVAMPVVILASSLVKTAALIPLTIAITITNTIGFIANTVLSAFSKLSNLFVDKMREPNLEGVSFSSTELANLKLGNSNKANPFVTSASVPLIAKPIDPTHSISKKSIDHVSDNFYSLMNHHDDAIKHKKVSNVDLSRASTDDDSDSDSEKPHHHR